MSQISSTAGRTTTLLSSDRLLSVIARTRSDILERQNQITTGLKVIKPSDSPSDSSAILRLQGLLEAREQTDSNLQFAGTVLNITDQALRDAIDIAREAHGLASSQIGTTTPEDRDSQLVVLDAQIKSLLEISNRETQGVTLFGGRHSTNDKLPFQEFLGGIRYIGSDEDLKTDVGFDKPLAFTSNGQTAFGALSSRVKGQVDLDPQATAATRLVDFNGAQGQGIRKGSIVVTIGGVPFPPVDLSTADTLGDVVTRINDVIGAAGSIAVSANGLTLTAVGTISIADQGSGQTAADLGIVISATAGSTVGSDIDPRLTELTTLASLGVTVDLVNGLKITQGSQTKIANFSTATTIQDMTNIVHQLGLGVRMEINAAGTGMDLVSEVSGLDLSIGENSGGTTAGDLGIRSFDTTTLLTDFRNQLGVDRQSGADISIHLHDGSSFTVDLDGVTTVGGVITAIQTAATAVPLSIGTPGTGGTQLNIGLAQDGNGFLFEDGTAGGNDFRVAQEGESLAATHMGIYFNVGSTGNTITGQDTATVRVDSVFTHMLDLREKLANDDTIGMTIAGTHLKNDDIQLTRIRAEVSVRGQRIEQQKTRSSEMKITEQIFLSDLRDADLTEAISSFTQLQQQLEASMLVGSQTLQLNLLDFLR